MSHWGQGVVGVLDAHAEVREDAENTAIADFLTAAINETYRLHGLTPEWHAARALRGHGARYPSPEPRGLSARQQAVLGRLGLDPAGWPLRDGPEGA